MIRWRQLRHRLQNVPAHDIEFDVYFVSLNSELNNSLTTFISTNTNHSTWKRFSWCHNKMYLKRKREFFSWIESRGYSSLISKKILQNFFLSNSWLLLFVVTVTVVMNESILGFFNFTELVLNMIKEFCSQKRTRTHCTCNCRQLCINFFRFTEFSKNTT